MKLVLCRSSDAVLTLEESMVTLGPRTVTLDALIAGQLDAVLNEQLGFIPFVEAIGRATLARDGRTVSAEPAPDRASAPRVFGGGRGGTWVVWIFGRNVRASGPGLDYDESFETFRAHDFPPALAAAIGAVGVADVKAAVATLADYPCMCGSGADTTSQHGQTDSFVYKQDTNIPIDRSATVARCTVCNRAWTYEEGGDPAYQMHYQVTRFVQALDPI